MPSWKGRQKKIQEYRAGAVFFIVFGIPLYLIAFVLFTTQFKDDPAFLARIVHYHNILSYCYIFAGTICFLLSQFFCKLSVAAQEKHTSRYRLFRGLDLGCEYLGGLFAAFCLSSQLTLIISIGQVASKLNN